ncbi:carboxypeptidase-like regulatory domain-containing protein [Pelobium manganitolerans]|nr:carboxypeptidase-like regulatory domain-containing protein [Pelobium manganitolerans]
MKTKRLLVLLALLCTFLLAQAQSLSDKKISVNYKNRFLAEVLKDLSKRYDLPFSYANNQINLDQRISLIAKNEKLSKVLDELCKQTAMQWQLVGGQIILKVAKQSPEKLKEPLTQTLRGQVVDKDSQTPLVGVSVQIISLDKPLATITDAAGNFRLAKVPVGRQHLAISYLGYETISNPELLLTSAKELVLNIEMKEAVNSLASVTVSDSRDRTAPLNAMASVSARSFSTEETSRYAAGNFDPARMVQSFPGVTFTDDLTNNIVIRGNSPKNLQWRLEGVEITNPNHYGEEGSSGGGISMISSNMLSKSDFFTGAFPAEYGNALSGVFDLQFRKGNTEKSEKAFMIGVLGTEISAEGPFVKNKNSSYLFNYRYSTLGLLKKIGINPVGDYGTPIFQDLAFNLNFPTKNTGTFSVFGIGGIGIQRDRADRNVNNWDSFEDKFDQDLNYSSFSGGIKNTSLLRQKGYLKNILSFSMNRNTDHTDTLDNNLNAGAFNRDLYLNQAIRYSGMVNYKTSEKTTLRSGVIGSLLLYNLNSLSYRRELGKLSQLVDEKGNSYLLEAYTQLQYQPTGKFTLNGGFHVNYFGLSQKVNVEPRVGANYHINDKNVLNFGFGLHSRTEPLLLYFGTKEQPNGAIIQSNKKLELTKSAHFVLGFEHRFNEALKFKTETYYQKMFDVPVSPNPSFPISTLNIDNSYLIYYKNYDLLVNKGTGENYGIEFSLERSLENGFYFLGTASLYSSTFNTIDNRTFNTPYNGKYNANVVIGKEYAVKENGKNLLGINVKSTLNGGKRYTPINLAQSIAEDDAVFYDDRTNTLKTSDYFRTDFSISYRINRPKVNHFLILDVQNLTNKQNVQSQFYSREKQKIENIYHSGLLPTFNYKIQF